MITAGDFKEYLKTQYPDTAFYNGCIDKDIKCIGVYARGNVSRQVGIGAPSSYNILPISLLIHWDESSDNCEAIANSIYEGLDSFKTGSIKNKRLIALNLMDSCPIGIGRDEKNRCEMTIRLNVIYER